MPKGDERAGGTALTTRPVIAVSGLAAECRIAAGQGVRTVAGGGDIPTLAAAIERAVVSGACGLISFGVAGALAPEWRPGAIVVARCVIGSGQDPVRSPTDRRWSSALLAALPGAVAADLAGSDRIVSDAAEKRDLCARTGAAVVDMESHVVAAAAARHGLPFAVLRAVADTSECIVPPAARIAMRPGGGVALGLVLASLARSPGQLPQLIAIAIDTRRALVALGNSRRLLRDRLGYMDLDQLALDVI